MREKDGKTQLRSDSNTTFTEASGDWKAMLSIPLTPRQRLWGPQEHGVYAQWPAVNQESSVSPARTVKLHSVTCPQVSEAHRDWEAVPSDLITLVTTGEAHRDWEACAVTHLHLETISEAFRDYEPMHKGTYAYGNLQWGLHIMTHLHVGTISESQETGNLCPALCSHPGTLSEAHRDCVSVPSDSEATATSVRLIARQPTRMRSN